MRFIKEHSLSITLFLGFALSAWLSKQFEHGTWGYDFWMMMAGSFGGSAILVVLATKLWERNSDPAKPPKEGVDEQE